MIKEFLDNCQRFDVVVPLTDPREWIANNIKKHAPELLCEKLFVELVMHLDKFLSMNAIHENLDLGRVYECEIDLGDKVSKWTFSYSEDNPYRATLSLYPTPEEKASQWQSPKK